MFELTNHKYLLPSFFYVGREVVHFQTVLFMNKNNQLWWLMHLNTLSFTYPPYHPIWIARLCPSTNRSYHLVALNTFPCQSSSHHPRWHLLFLNLDVPQKHSGKYREKQCIHVKTGNSDGRNHGKFSAMVLNLIALRHSVTLCKITSCCPKPFGAPHFGREEMRGLPQSVWPSLTFDQTSVSVSPRFSGQLRDFYNRCRCWKSRVFQW